MENDLTNKSILIVGANGAMAKETIKHLISDGAQNIIMACRSATKGEEAAKEIASFYPAFKGKLTVVGGFDMTNPLLIENAIKELSDHQPFDIVFLAAGFAVFTDDYQHIVWNDKKVEKTIFQNMVGSHITFKLLMQHQLIAKNARVLMAGGEGARGINGMIEKPVFDSAQTFRDYVYLNQAPTYNPMNAIGVSKLCGALWTKKIAELENGNMDIVWFSPGLTSGSAGLKSLSFAKRTMMSMLFVIMGLLGKSQTPQAGGRKYADCLTGLIGKNGNLLGAPQGKSIGEITDQTPMNSAFSNQSLIDEFWRILEEVTGEYLSYKS